jgi:surfactin synthase thioesterase subunit
LEVFLKSYDTLSSKPASSKPAFFLLAHGSGSAYHYLEAFPKLNEAARLVPAELPGHGKRRSEALLDDLLDIGEDLAENAVNSLTEESGFSYYAFGHSMGALTAYLLILGLLKRGFTGVKRFFVSSYSVPGWHPIPVGMREMPDEAMWLESARRFGVLNDQPLPPPERMELHSRVYRADLKAVENFTLTEKKLIPSPITVFFAENDMVDLQLAEPWKDFGLFGAEIIKVQGGHFHPLENPDQLQKLVIDRL